MSRANGSGRKDVTIRAPIAAAGVRAGAAGVPIPAAPPGVMAMTAEEVVALQGSRIRELETQLNAQQLAASTFANAIACLALMLAEAEGRTWDSKAVVPRTLIERFDGAHLALDEDAERALHVTVTERGETQ